MIRARAFTFWRCSNTKQKRAYQKKAAGYVADLILDSLENLAEPERQARLKQVHAALSGGSPRSQRFDSGKQGGKRKNSRPGGVIL